MKKDRIIVGTSAWGSKISLRNSFLIGKKLINNGFNHFDTAPNYGSGYSHQILNQLANKKIIYVDTKFGDKHFLNLREILKRIYRFHNLRSFVNSFNYLEFKLPFRSSQFSWNLVNLENSIRKFENDLSNCKIKTIYLHGPPLGIIDIQYIEQFIAITKRKRLLSGISWPNKNDLETIKGFSSSFQLQVSINFFHQHKEFILSNFENVSIAGLFKKVRNEKLGEVSIKYFMDELSEIFSDKKKYKLTIGINSENSIDNLLRYL